MKGNLKVIVIGIFLSLVVGLTLALGMPYDKLDWENYALAYPSLTPTATPSGIRIFLPLILKQPPLCDPYEPNDAPPRLGTTDLRPELPGQALLGRQRGLLSLHHHQPG